MLQGDALALDRAVVEAVGAAQARDGPRFEAAQARLELADPQHLRRLLAGVVRPLLEDLNPDGVDGDGLADLIDKVSRDPLIEPLAVAVVLTGAFGIEVATRQELPAAVTEQAVTRHAVLLLAHLVTGDRRLRRYLDLAWAEIARSDGQDDQSG